VTDGSIKVLLVAALVVLWILASLVVHLRVCRTAGSTGNNEAGNFGRK
jgi:hypothetical protein